MGGPKRNRSQRLSKKEGRSSQSQLCGPKRNRVQGLSRRRAVIVKVGSWVALRETECKVNVRRMAVIVKMASWVALTTA